jgi:hypothetical protein
VTLVPRTEAEVEVEGFFTGWTWSTRGDAGAVLAAGRAAGRPRIAYYWAGIARKP